MLILLPAGWLQAQGTFPVTYIFSIVNYGSPQAISVEAAIAGNGGNVSATVDYPEAQSSFVIADLRPSQMGAVIAAFPPGAVVAEENQPLEPAGSGSSGPYAPTIPVNYALNKVVGSDILIPPCRNPVRFVAIDSGVRYPLGDFPPFRVSFAPPYIPPTVLSPSGGPSVPFLPGVWAGVPTADADELDHGTGVISCAVGTQAGVLGRVPSVPAVVQSFRVHRRGACAALVSDAVQALAKAAQDEALRELDGSLGNDAAIITFPYRTVCGLSYAIDHQIWKASRAGALVICGTGNNNVATQPSTAGSYPLADPNQDIFCVYTNPPVNPGSPARLGPTVARTPPCPSTPCLGYFLFAGGSSNVDTRWSTDAINGSNYGIETDVYAPGESVSVASSTSINAFRGASGTSFSCGYAAGNASYYLTQRPWAKPEDVRTWLMTLTAAPTPVSIAVSPSGTRYRLSLTNRLPVSCCLDYTSWTAEHRLTGGSSVAAADFDSDGLTNLVEYAVGSDPRLSTPAAGLWIQNVGGVNYLRMARAFWLNAECGVTFRVECSPDLMTWSDITSGFTPLSPDARDNDGVIHQHSTPLPGPASRLHYRIFVSIP